MIAVKTITCRLFCLCYVTQKLILPLEETKEIKAALERDTVRYLARFAEVATSRPIEYTFLL